MMIEVGWNGRYVSHMSGRTHPDYMARGIMPKLHFAVVFGALHQAFPNVTDHFGMAVVKPVYDKHIALGRGCFRMKWVT